MLALLCVQVVACSNGLSRSEARRLIDADFKPVPFEINLAFGQHCSGGRVPFEFEHVNGFGLTSQQYEERLKQNDIDAAMSREYIPSQVKILLERNLVTLTTKSVPSCPQIPKMVGYSQTFAEWSLSLTETGKALGVQPNLVLANRQFTEVTGITSGAEPSVSVAEYTWRWKLTAMGERLKFLAPDDSPVQGKATWPDFFIVVKREDKIRPVIPTECSVRPGLPLDGPADLQ